MIEGNNQISRDLLLLLNFSVDQAISIMIGQRLAAAPDIKVPLEYSRMLNDTHVIAEAFIRTRIARGTEVYADEAASWNELHARHTLHRISWQGRGVGRALVAEAKRAVGPGCNVVLLSAPQPMTYYPRIGMERIDNAFIIRRDR